MEGFPWDDLRKIFTKGSQMAKVPNGVKTLRKISITWVGCTNVTDDRQTTAYSEREHEFTFAKNLHSRSYTTWKNSYPSFLTRGMVTGEARPLVPKILGQTDPIRAITPIFNRYSLVAPQQWHLAKKFNYQANRKSTTCFPMSLRSTS